MMLRGMGFSNDTSIYLASGKIYQAGRHLAPLLMMFPHLHTKESLATLEEIAPYEVNFCTLSICPSLYLQIVLVTFRIYSIKFGIFIFSYTSNNFWINCGDAFLLFKRFLKF